MEWQSEAQPVARGRSMPARACHRSVPVTQTCIRACAILRLGDTQTPSNHPLRQLSTMQTVVAQHQMLEPTSQAASGASRIPGSATTGKPGHEGEGTNLRGSFSVFEQQ